MCCHARPSSRNQTLGQRPPALWSEASASDESFMRRAPTPIRHWFLAGRRARCSVLTMTTQQKLAVSLCIGLLARAACPWPLGVLWAPLLVALLVASLTPLWLIAAARVGARGTAAAVSSTRRNRPACACNVAELHTHYFFTGTHIVHAEASRKKGHAVDGIGQAEIVKNTKNVGAELDASTEFPKFAACSKTVTAWPSCASAAAVASPPMPPPAMRNECVCTMLLMICILTIIFLGTYPDARWPSACTRAVKAP